MLGFDPLSGAPLSALGAPAAAMPGVFLRGLGTLGCATGCGCEAPCAPTTFVVFGCNSAKYSGLTVSVYASSGGALLTSGTTNAMSEVTLSTGVGGNLWVTITGQNARFANFARTLFVLCGGQVNLVMSPATGYNCFPVHDCSLPWASTLYASGHQYILFPGCDFTNLPYIWGGSTVYAAALVIPVPCGYGSFNSDGAVFNNDGGGIAGSLMVTCPPSFVATWADPGGGVWTWTE